MANFHIVEWPFLGVIILLQLLHLVIIIWIRYKKYKQFHKPQESSERCPVRVTNTPRSSAQNTNTNANAGPSRDNNIVPDEEYAVVNTSMKKNNRKIGIEPVTDVKFNIHQENQVYCNVPNSPTNTNGEYMNVQNHKEDEYLTSWDIASKTNIKSALTKINKIVPFVKK